MRRECEAQRAGRQEVIFVSCGFTFTKFVGKYSRKNFSFRVLPQYIRGYTPVSVGGVDDADVVQHDPTERSPSPPADRPYRRPPSSYRDRPTARTTRPRTDVRYGTYRRTRRTYLRPTDVRYVRYRTYRNRTTGRPPPAGPTAAVEDAVRTYGTVRTDRSVPVLGFVPFVR